MGFWDGFNNKNIVDPNKDDEGSKFFNFAPTKQENADIFNNIIAPTLKPKYDFTADTMPIVAKNNPKGIIDLANNSSNGLTTNSLIDSNLPLWKQILASPIAQIGDWVKGTNESTLGSRFMGSAGGITMDKGTPIQPVGSAGPILNTVANLGGSTANAYLQGGGGQVNLFKGGSELASIAPKTALAQYGANALGTGANLGAFSGLDTYYKGGNAKDILKSAGEGALAGAGFGVLGKGATELAPKLLDIPVNKEQAIKDAFKQQNGIFDRPLNQTRTSTIEPILKPNTINMEQPTPRPIEIFKPADNINTPTQSNIFANSPLKAQNIASSVKSGGVDTLTGNIPKEFKPPTDLQGNPLPDPKIVSSNIADKIPLKQKLNDAYTATVDINKPMYDFSKIAKDQTHTLAANSANHASIADRIITKELVNREGNPIGKSLKDLYKDIPTDPKGTPKDDQGVFMHYMMEKHNIDRAREGKPVIPNHTSEQSSVLVDGIEQQHPEWATKAKEITDWTSKFMKEWGVDAGTLDKNLYDANTKMYPNYIPSNRDFSSLESMSRGNGGSNSGYANQTTPIKRATGSARDIIDPRESLANMVMRTVKTAKSNEVAQSMVNSLRNNPEKLKGFAEIVPEPNGNVKNVVRVLEGGNPTYVKINNLGFLKSIENLNTSSTGKIESFTKKYLTNPFKSLITTKNPIFAGTNAIKDLPTAYTMGSEHNPLKFGANYLKAGKDILTKSDSWNQYKGVGGGGSNLFDSSNPAKSIKKLTTNNNLLVKGLKSIPHGIESFNNFTENVPRFSEFQTVLKKTGDLNKSLYAANELTTNFARHGDLTKHVDSFVPYLNPGVQGLDKIGRQLITKPVQTIGKGLLGVTVPTMIFNHMNKDNENYKNLDNRTKDSNFLIPTKDGTFIKIPKSRELGVLFGSLAERTLRAAQGDKKAFNDFAYSSNEKNPIVAVAKSTIGTNFAPANPFENNILSPLTLNLATNKDFADRAIVPQSMIQDGRSPRYQYDEKTSELAKKLGDVANLSPKQIDYVIRSYTGIVGQVGLPAATKTPGKTPLQNALQPITNKFIADPNYSNSATTDFYNNLDKLKQIAADKNINEKIPSKLVTKEEALRNQFTKASTEMSKLNKQVSATSDPNKIKDLRKQILGIANNTNKLVK